MKNAYVLEHHFGDSGDTPEGAILHDITTKRFEELERKGLIRAATDDEVKAGYQPPFVPDDSEGNAAAKKKSEPLNKKAAEPANKAA